jgi:hypothetical protein
MRNRTPAKDAVTLRTTLFPFKSTLRRGALYPPEPPAVHAWDAVWDQGLQS